MNKKIHDFFAEFSTLKYVSRDFWLTNGIQFFDGLAYFSMINILAMYLQQNCGFSDVDSNSWVGYYTLFVTAFLFAIGAVCDIIGIKRSLYIGLSLLLVARFTLWLSSNESVCPKDPLNLPALEFMGQFSMSQLVAIGALVILAMGTSFISPVTQTALRRFTTKENRATGFNVYYLLMNVGAFVASAVILEGFRNDYLGLRTLFAGGGQVGPEYGNTLVINFGFCMTFFALLCSWLINEHNYADESERVGKAASRPLKLFMEVWSEKLFQRLVLFLLFTLGVRAVFTLQFLVMPKYYTRALYEDFELGWINSINPFIIIVGLIALIPIIKRFSTIKLMIVGMTISAFSLVFMAVPIEWIMMIPGIATQNQAYFFVIISQILVFAVGELIFSPRFSEYIASVAPKDKVASYMALAGLPMFIAKPIIGLISGFFLSWFCYDGIRAKIDSGNVGYLESPEWMWMIYLIPAVLSPLAVIYSQKWLIPQSPATEQENARKVEEAVEGETYILEPAEQEAEFGAATKE